MLVLARKENEKITLSLSVEAMKELISRDQPLEVEVSTFSIRNFRCLLGFNTNVDRDILIIRRKELNDANN